MIIEDTEHHTQDTCSVCWGEADKQYDGTPYFLDHYQERLAREQLW